MICSWLQVETTEAVMNERTIKKKDKRHKKVVCQVKTLCVLSYSLSTKSSSRGVVCSGGVIITSSSSYPQKNITKYIDKQPPFKTCVTDTIIAV